MGVVHVITGPDHLSALATLSANVGNFQAFWFGVRWGIGHSIGLLVVGSILISIDYNNNNQNEQGENDYEAIGISTTFTNLCEILVGIFMVILGIYGLRSAHVKKNNPTIMATTFDEAETLNEERHIDNNEHNLFPLRYDTIGDVETNGVLELSPPSESKERQYEHDNHNINVHDGVSSMSLADVSKNDAMGNIADVSHNYHHHHHHHGFCCQGNDHCCGCEVSKPVLSLGIGMVHGIAGPGGVLGVLPAVQLHNWRLAACYLLTFCSVSILTMGGFAGLYGTLSSYISKGNNIEYKVEMFSSGLSLFVGVLWLFLLSIGQLHNVFP